MTMSEQHIASAFDRELESIQAHIMKMGGLVEAAIGASAASLETRDEELALKVRADDKAIDALEMEINEDATRIIALRAPMSKDLRAILTTLRLAASLERIGDYAKNIAKRTTTLVDVPPVNGTDSAHADEGDGLLRTAVVIRKGDTLSDALTRAGAKW